MKYQKFTENVAPLDPAFTPVAEADYSTDTLARALLNARGNSQPTLDPKTATALDYLRLRGGINRQGFYGDSFNSKLHLTDDEHYDVMLKAKQEGNTDPYGAVYAAVIAKRARNGFNPDMSPTFSSSTAPTATAISTVTTPYTLNTSNNLVSSIKTPDPTPITPKPSSVVKTPPTPPVKTAPIDTVLFNDDSMSIEIMADLIFEDIGGHELINIARNDIINGQQVSYTPIKNLGLIQQTYNPNNILRLQSTSEKYFANFAIKLEEKIPLVGNGPNGSNVYIDPTTGDLIIEGININKDELFEVELSLNGTIYEANFGATTS